MPICELCGQSDFVKQDGMFVCQGCGTKYTLEEARKLSAGPVPSQSQGNPANAIPYADAQQGEPKKPDIGSVVGGLAAVALGALANALQGTADFQPEVASAQAQDVRGINNYICQGWQMVIEEYKKQEHPTIDDLDKVVVRAKECLMALEKAALAEPEKYVQNALIYGNCIELVNSVERLDCYEQKEGNWKRVFSPLKYGALKLPGQNESWEDKQKVATAAIEDEYINAHPEEVEQRAELCKQADEIQQDIDVLKAEKKSKGFFNFSEKREVNERLNPVKDHLSEVKAKIRALDNNIERYVTERIGDLETSFIRLNF